MAIAETGRLHAPRWLVLTLYVITCISLAILHDGQLYGWLPALPRGIHQLLVPLCGPSLALNTHMSLALFIPMAGLLAIPLVFAVEERGWKRSIAAGLFAVGWLASGVWLATLF